MAENEMRTQARQRLDARGVDHGWDYKAIIAEGAAAIGSLAACVGAVYALAFAKMAGWF